jgi:glutathione S-transferase
MPKVEIIGSSRSTYTRVVRMVCEEKAIDYALSETALGAAELFAVHPFGKMPLLRHGDFELCESKAIATYLDRAFPGPKLIPDEPRLAALTEQWVSLVNTVIDRTLVRTYLLAYAAPETADGRPDRSIIDATTPALRDQFKILDKAVAGGGHLVGDQFTLADINLMPLLFYMHKVPESAAAFAEATHLTAYYDRHAARPSFTRTIPPPGPPRRADPTKKD